MNREEFDQEVKTLKSCFNEVSITDYSDLDNPVLDSVHIYDALIAKEVFDNKKEVTKLKVIDENTYYIMANYYEVDSKPYVVESVQKMNYESMVDSKGRKRLLKELKQYEKLIYYDTLTNTFNRDFYEDEIKGKKMTCGIAVIDMDDFRLYNDTFGHGMGDEVLKEVANIIKDNISIDDCLIRYGGDEFLLIMPNVSDEDFSSTLNLILKKVNGLSVQGYSKIGCSLSIGATLCENEDIDEGLKKADKLMYLAKNKKNVIVFEENQFDNMEQMKQTVLIVDDSQMNREILSDILNSEFNIIEAENGLECIKAIRKYGTEISLILLDINMPVMTGDEVLSYMTRRGLSEDIPVIMISSEDDSNVIRQVYALGATDYISRPFDSKIVFQRVYNTMKLYSKQRRLYTLVNNQSAEKEKNNGMMVGILSHIVEFRNQESGLHIVHLKQFSKILMNQLVMKSSKYNLSKEDIDLISLGSALHDIGKIGIDEKILNKPGRLTKEEFEIIKTHTVIGDEMLSSLNAYQDEPLIKIGHEICRWHHERWDGKGYPDGLKGEQIPISAQIVSVVDVYDALTSERVYKKAIPHEKALEMIQNGECGNFNPLLLECLMDVGDDLKAILEHEKEIYGG